MQHSKISNFKNILNMKQYSILSFVAILSLASCGKKNTVTNEKKAFAISDTMMHMIAIDSVQYSHIGDEISLSGEITFNENNVVKIFPRSSGQVIETRVTMGDKVNKGQVLAIIRSADVAGNFSDLHSAEASLSIAKRAMENAESLYKGGISSEREYTEAKENYQKALADKNKTQSVININGGGNANATGQYQILSPIDGYVVEKKIAAGSFIRTDMGDNLFTISDLKNVWVNANVYEADIAKVRAGYEAKISTIAYPDKVFTGKIETVGRVLDPQSKAMQVRISLPNTDQLLKPEMFAKVIVTNQEGTTALNIPTAALVAQDGKNYVVVFNSATDVKIAEVSILKTVGDRTFINSGVSVGQKLIVKNQLLVFTKLLGE
jgi:membrane fusion protein, heavy metal efflux system